MFIKHHYHHNPLKNIYLKNNMKKRKVIVKKKTVKLVISRGCEKYITRSISKKRLKNKSRKAENLSPSVVLFSFHFLYF